MVPAGGALQRALELAETIANYPGQAGIRADRASTIAAYDQPLRDGLDREGRDGLDALSDPSLGEAIAAFAEGARPESPRPAG